VIYLTQRWPFRLVIQLGFLFILKWPHVVGSLQEDPQEFLPPGCHTVPGCSLWPRIYDRNDGLRLVYKRWWLLSCVFPGLLAGSLLVHTLWGKPIATLWRHSGTLRGGPCGEGVRPPNNRNSELRKELPTPTEPWDDCRPVSSLTGTSWESMSQTHPANLSPIPELRNHEMMNICHFKLATFCGNVLHGNRWLIHHTQ